MASASARPLCGGQTVRDDWIVTSSSITAMDMVRRARDNEITREDLVAALMAWQFEPQYRTQGLSDDWESRPDSFDAVEYAYAIDLLDDAEYGLIAARVDRAERADPMERGR